jgi:hypothetical protein
VLVNDEGIAIVAIEPVSRGKPHEAATILQNCSHITLRQAIVGSEVGEIEVSHLNMSGTCDLSWSSFSCYSVRTVNNAEKQNPARNAKGPGGILADGDHAIADHPLAVCWQSITFRLENQSVKTIPPSRSRAGDCSSL